MNNGGRQQHPSGSGTDISRAATFCSASESSTPFISPQGTPITFNRIRHKLKCRSRHSSGVPMAGGSYRYQTMPYSPMALNNLNNPFSPQPSTPICQPDMAEPSYQSNINQFVSPFEDPMSRHYRPAQWQPNNGEQTLQTEFSLNNEVSSLLTDNMSERGQYNYYQSKPATPGGGIDNGGPPIRELLLNHWGDQHRQPLSPLSPIPQVFT